MSQTWMEKQVQGLPESQRQQAYYTLQRQNAEEGQDYGTLDKINQKLGKQTQRVSRNIPQAEAENYAMMGLGALPLGRLAEGAGGLIGGGLKALANRAGARTGESLISRALPAAEEAPAVRGAETAQKAVKGSKAQKAIGSSKGAPKSSAPTKMTRPPGAKPRSGADVAKDFAKSGKGTSKVKPAPANPKGQGVAAAGGAGVAASKPKKATPKPKKSAPKKQAPQNNDAYQKDLENKLILEYPGLATTRLGY